MSQPRLRRPETCRGAALAAPRRGNRGVGATELAMVICGHVVAPRLIAVCLVTLAACGSADHGDLFSGGSGPGAPSGSGGGAGSGVSGQSGGPGSGGAGPSVGGGGSATGGGPVGGGTSGGGTAAAGAVSSGGVGAAGAGASGGTSIGGSAGATGSTDGGIPSGPTPGNIACGDTPCPIAGTPPNVCCIAPPPFPVGCYPSFPGCITGGVQLACDDAADCAPGEICCGSAAGGPAGCVTTCDPATSVQLCRTDAECVSGTCETLAEAPAYETCQ